jgi:succinate-semialdehyde dehydrogenase/glutarate-semialdehyde dehydrogenase
MQSAADILRRETESYAKLLTIEMGKLFSEAKAEVELSANIFEYYSQKAEALLAPEKLPVASPVEGEAVLVLEPLGVLLAVEPRNFPYYQIARIIAPQLSAGNTILLKHAANVPQCAAAFEKLMRDPACLAVLSGTSMPRAHRSSAFSMIRASRVLRSRVQRTLER